MIKLKIQDDHCSCETDITEFSGEDMVTDASIEIKGALFSMMLNEFRKFSDLGLDPAVTLADMCTVIGVDVRDFLEFLEEVEEDHPLFS